MGASVSGSFACVRARSCCTACGGRTRSAARSLAPKAIDLDDDQIERAVQLTDTMAMDDASGFRDQYRDALEELIAAKSEGKELREPAEERESGRSWT